MWAIIVAHFCNNWMNYTMLTCLPKYMKDVLQLGLNDKSDVSFMLVTLYTSTLCFELIMCDYVVRHKQGDCSDKVHSIRVFKVDNLRHGLIVMLEPWASRAS